MQKVIALPFSAGEASEQSAEDVYVSLEIAVTIAPESFQGNCKLFCQV
jgi:hypothetical protein